MKNTNPKLRIPIGSRVRWRARYESDPMNEGIVRAFVPRGGYFPGSHRVNASADIYIVDMDRTPSGRPRKTIKVMLPYAVRLEEQNKGLLAPVEEK